MSESPPPPDFCLFFPSLPSVCQIVILRQRAAEVGENFFDKNTQERDRRERIFIIKIFCRPPGQERRFFKEK